MASSTGRLIVRPPKPRTALIISATSLKELLPFSAKKKDPPGAFSITRR
jgi:hypothetical protein